MLKTVFAIRPIFRETWETDYQFDHYEIAQGLLFKEEKNYFEDREPISFFNVLFEETPKYNIYSGKCVNTEEVEEIYETEEEAKKAFALKKNRRYN